MYTDNETCLVKAQTTNRRSALFDSHQLAFQRCDSKIGPRTNVPNFSAQLKRLATLEPEEIKAPEYPATLDSLQTESLAVLQKFDLKAFQVLIDLCRDHGLCAPEVDYMLHMTHNRRVMQHRYKEILQNLHNALIKNNLRILFLKRIKEIFCTSLVDAAKSAKKTALYHMIGHFIEIKEDVATVLDSSLDRTAGTPEEKMLIGFLNLLITYAVGFHDISQKRVALIPYYSELKSAQMFCQKFGAALDELKIAMNNKLRPWYRCCCSISYPVVEKLIKDAKDFLYFLASEIIVGATYLIGDFTSEKGKIPMCALIQQFEESLNHLDYFRAYMETPELDLIRISAYATTFFDVHRVSFIPVRSNRCNIHREPLPLFKEGVRTLQAFAGMPEEDYPLYALLLGQNVRMAPELNIFTPDQIDIFLELIRQSQNLLKHPEFGEEYLKQIETHYDWLCPALIKIFRSEERFAQKNADRMSAMLPYMMLSGYGRRLETFFHNNDGLCLIDATAWARQADYLKALAAFIENALVNIKFKIQVIAYTLYCARMQPGLICLATNKEYTSLLYALKEEVTRMTNRDRGLVLESISGALDETHRESIKNLERSYPGSTYYYA